MKIAITDACIFIELYGLVLIDQFFCIDCEVHTSVDVINELYEEQKEFLSAFHKSNKLFVHSISESDRLIIHNTEYPRGLSEVDKTVLFLAKNYDAMI